MNAVRSVALIGCALRVAVGLAQPGCPDITFTLVSDAKGKPLAGIYAEDVITRHDLARKGVESWSVEEHFTSHSPYDPHRDGEHKWWMCNGVPLAVPGKKRLQFQFIDCWCTTHYIMVYNGKESMRMDLPDASADRWALVQHVMKRSGDRSSPEVIRFRPGRFSYAELMMDSIFDALEARLANQIKDAANASYKKQLRDLEAYYRDLPPPAPLAVVPSVPEIPLVAPGQTLPVNDQPGLKKVEVDRMNADTVWVRVTGRVMLDGGCASGMPLFGIEMRTDTGWVERMPFPTEQMDCGMPWATWDQHVVKMPSLRWWVGAHQPQGKKEVAPGTYRLVLLGGDGSWMPTDAFEVE